MNPPWFLLSELCAAAAWNACLPPSSTSQVVALSAGRNIDVLSEQIKKFKPKMVSISDGAQIDDLKVGQARGGWNNESPRPCRIYLTNI